MEKKGPEFAPVEQAIREAFKDVKKGNGTGIREAIALDDYAEREALEKAAREDVEEWQDIPKEFHDRLTTALAFANDEGFKHLLPAAMIFGDEPGSVQFFLVFGGQLNAPHHGHPEFTDYLRSIDPKKVMERFQFTKEQVHAIALYFKWWMKSENDYFYANRESCIELLKRMNKIYRDAARKGDYTLTVEDEINNFDEECRIMRELLALGGVEV